MEEGGKEATLVGRESLEGTVLELVQKLEMGTESQAGTY